MDTIFGAECSIPHFSIHLGEKTFFDHDFSLRRIETPEGKTVYRGDCSVAGWSSPIQAIWIFTPCFDGWQVTLELHSPALLTQLQLDSLIIDYSPGSNLDPWRIITIGLGVESVGMIQVCQLSETMGENPIQGKAGEAKYALGSLMRGAFPNSRKEGIFLGTILPQKHAHLYKTERTSQSKLRFTATTSFVASYQPQPDENGMVAYKSETTWISTVLTVREAITAYAAHFQEIPLKRQPIGWNSWDYYFSALKLEDILENIHFIREDVRLKQSLQYAVIDMGWEHCWGEWQPNYRFPGGLEQLVKEIQACGLIPGIWTAPLIVNQLSYPGLRQGDMLIKNEFGDPWSSPEGGQYVIDPTHPAGKVFLREIFTRLYRIGFRLFKIDYVGVLVGAPRFHDSNKGPYEALANFFCLVRECVGEESHILGCSLPEECGPGLSDSQRTGIDIHNQWTHVEWAVDFYQFAYWQHGRISGNDPDFLVVRGLDTSRETETNVLNPMAHHPNPPRWRHGPVFTLEEARTWATFVSLVGGSVFLSDRLTKLNETGLELVHKVIVDASSNQFLGGVIPLDLAEGIRPSIWYASGENKSRLGIINWQDTSITRKFSFTDWGLPTPDLVADFWTGASIPVLDDSVLFSLAPHASAYITW